MIRRATVYPDDVSVGDARMDIIEPAAAQTIDGLFRLRVARTPQQTAYIEYDHAAKKWRAHSWRDIAREVDRRQCAIEAESFSRGARVAICLPNGRQWIAFDQACLAAGLVITPLYFDDRADNIAYILTHTAAELLIVSDAKKWRAIADELPKRNALKRVVIVDGKANNQSGGKNIDNRDIVRSLDAWQKIGNAQSETNAKPAADSNALATIVYTSGTTGKPKGVMLSHGNLLDNARAGLRSVPIFPHDKFLSFLPLSHMFERTVGYYLPMMAGASVAFNRAIENLADDLIANRPTIMISVPRIFERVHAAITARLEDASPLKRKLFAKAIAVGWRRFEISQRRAKWRADQLLWQPLNILVARKIRARFGGKLRFVVSGGAPLAGNISRMFIALGIDILQGYGLTETSPTLTVNTLTRNKPQTIGLPFIGTQIRLSANGELQAKSSSVMCGYWKNEKATRECIEGGWFSSGDLASIDDQGFISITGRLKEIIVLATGEKVPPADMEAAICDHPLFDQCMVIGEGRAFLSALVVVNAQAWVRMNNVEGAKAFGGGNAASANALTDSTLTDSASEKFLLETIAECIQNFPGYAAIHRVHAVSEAWTVANAMLTPTLKIKRGVLREKFAGEIEKMYQKHASKTLRH